MIGHVAYGKQWTQTSVGYIQEKKKKKLVWGMILNERQYYRFRQPFPYVIIGYNIHGRHFQLWDSLVRDFH